MSRPQFSQFSIQPLEPRRMLAGHTVQEFAAALGEPVAPHPSEFPSLKAELGLVADTQALDRNVTELRSALADLAKMMSGG